MNFNTVNESVFTLNKKHRVKTIIEGDKTAARRNHPQVS